MSEGSGKRPVRGRAAARFDEITLAAFTILLFVTVASVLAIGMATAEDRIGCGLNDVVNALMAYPRPCH